MFFRYSICFKTGLYMYFMFSFSSCVSKTKTKTSRFRRSPGRSSFVWLEQISQITIRFVSGKLSLPLIKYNIDTTDSLIWISSTSASKLVVVKLSWSHYTGPEQAEFHKQGFVISTLARNLVKKMFPQFFWDEILQSYRIQERK